MGELAKLRGSSRAALCLECGKCSSLCPLAGLPSFSASRVMAIRDPGSDGWGPDSAVERCLTCGACELRCPQGVRFTSYVRGLRHERPPAAAHPCPHGEVLQAAARLAAGAGGNGGAPARDLSWLGPDLRVAEQGEVALFVGCLPLFDALFAEEMEVRPLAIARSAVRLLNQLGIEPVVAADERCCGHDLLWQGDEETFGLLAAANAEAFAARGVRHIVTTCAECARTWRLDYPDAAPGYRPRVQHLSEFLAERLEGGTVEFRPGAESTVTFHDPCRLGRHLGVVDAPRRLLAGLPATRLVEMDRSGRDAVCCGTPGFMRCDAASRELQVERLASAAATGAATLLTACPKCLIHFACAQAEDRRRERPTPALAVEDLTVFAAARLAEPEGHRHPPDDAAGRGAS